MERQTTEGMRPIDQFCPTCGAVPGALCAGMSRGIMASTATWCAPRAAIAECWMGLAAAAAAHGLALERPRRRVERGAFGIETVLGEHPTLVTLDGATLFDADANEGPPGAVLPWISVVQKQREIAAFLQGYGKRR